MKKIAFLLTFCCVLSMTVYGQNATQSRSFKPFTGVSACCGINLHIKDGNSPLVEVHAKSDIIDDIVTEVKSNTLVVSFARTKKNEKRKSDNVVHVYITNNKYTFIEASSGASIKSDNQIKSKDIKIVASSAGTINLNLNADNLKSSTDSGGSINLKGQANSAKISSDSGGNINMKDMASKKVEVEASSGADISITVNNELIANASSGSSIKYYGNPSKTKTVSNSGGSVTRK